MPTMIDKDFSELAQSYTQRINHFFAQHLSSYAQSPLKEAMLYSLLAGGKRIRPFLVYATGSMFGGEIEKLDYCAAAVEAIHTYSLIHDDLPAMDNDSLRRGMPTCHIQYGESQAILAGDALQTLAFSLLVQAPNIDSETKVKHLQELTLASGLSGMCLGQSLDLLSEHKTITLTELKMIHQHKTGAIIKAAIRLGALSAGANAQPYLDNLNNYADAIGLAFQIQDDILDVIGDKTVMGKNQGVDIKAEKNTYLSLLGLEKSIQIRQELYQQAIEELNKIPYNSEQLLLLADFIVHRDN